MMEQKTIPVAISARHVHLTEENIGRLFGTGYRLRLRTPLRQPGQFAAEESVTLEGPKGRLTHVRIVGPPRAENQVEISRTDELILGLDAPVRVSGELARTPGIRVVGPVGSVQLDHGVVLAQRHLHMSLAEAEELGVHDRDEVQVALTGHGRDLIFQDVIVRVSPNYRLELHLDTDEGNAAGVQPGDRARLLGSDAPGSTVNARC